MINFSTIGTKTRLPNYVIIFSINPYPSCSILLPLPAVIFSSQVPLEAKILAPLSRQQSSPLVCQQLMRPLHDALTGAAPEGRRIRRWVNQCATTYKQG